MESDKSTSYELLDIAGRGSSLSSLRLDGKQTKKPEIMKPAPSSVLSRVRAFLPQLEKANAELEQTDDDVNIEHVEDDEQYIEMNLALVPRDDDSDEDETSDNDDGDHVTTLVGNEINENTLKLPCDTNASKAKPVIEVLTTDNQRDSHHEDGVS